MVSKVYKCVLCITCGCKVYRVLTFQNAEFIATFYTRQFCLSVSFGEGGNKKNEQPSINSANDIAARWSSFCA